MIMNIKYYIINFQNDVLMIYNKFVFVIIYLLYIVNN